MAEETQTSEDVSISGDTDSIVNPGDVRIYGVLLKGETGEIDITNYVLEINLYEDIFGTSLHGTIAIRDTVNLIDRFPIVGNELITINVGTPSYGGTEVYNPEGKIQKTFAVYGIKNRQLTNADKEQMYNLHFISLEGAKDNITYLSQKFEGKTDEVAKELWEKIKAPSYIPDGETTGEDTLFTVGDTPHETEISFVAPYWTPMQCMNYLANRCIGQKSKAPTFLFFESLSGFFLTSIQSLIDTQLQNGLVNASYLYLDKSMVNRNTIQGLVDKFNKVEDCQFITNLDMLQGQDTGHYTSNMYVFDMVRKEVNQYIYDHGIEADQYEHLEDYVLGDDGKYQRDEEHGKQNTIFPANIMRTSDSKTFIKSIHPGVTGRSITDGLINLSPEKHTQQRNSLFLDLNTLKMNIKVPGRTDMYVGMIVDFKYPSVSSKSENTPEEEFFDKRISGKYLVTAIHHLITKFRHTMFLEIAKDSFVNSPGKFDMVNETATSDETESAANSASDGDN